MRRTKKRLASFSHDPGSEGVSRTRARSSIDHANHRPFRPKDDLVQGETQRGSRQGMRDRRGRGQCRTGYWRDFGLLLFPFEEKNRRRTILSLFLLRRERETRSPHLAARKTLAHADFTSRKNKGSSLAAFYRARKYVLFIEIYSIIRI